MRYIPFQFENLKKQKEYKIRETKMCVQFTL